MQNSGQKWHIRNLLLTLIGRVVFKNPLREISLSKYIEDPFYWKSRTCCRNRLTR